MAEGYLLDTNAAIAILRTDPAFQDRLEDEADYYVCPTVLGELFFGAHGSAPSRRAGNLAQVEKLVTLCPVLEYDLLTADQYGRIHQELRRKGRMVPYHDMWIAACALRHEFVLVTRDRHFDEIDGLSHQPW